MKSIIINDLEKSYKSVQALKSISFDVEEGELFGLIGPDGAGKTTLIRILTTLLLPGKGNASVLGFDTVKEFKEIRKLIGYMPGKFALYQDLTIEENLNLFATIFGTTVKQNYDLIAPIYKQIEPFKKRPAGKLSGGMKQKLALSCALIHKPEVLFLDEPTTGVDPVSRKEFWDMLKDLKAHGITIFVSTPYMDEAMLCDRVGLIQDGAMLSIDKPINIIKSFPKPIYSIQSDNIYLLLETLNKYQNTHSAYPFGDKVHYIDKHGTINQDDLKLHLISDKIANPMINKIEPNIEDCFMELMVKQ